MLKYPPTEKDKQRLSDYEVYEKLFLGDHFNAFGVKADSVKQGMLRDYAQLRYLAINMAGMLSTLSADMLFEEFPTIRLSKEKYDWNEAFMQTNKLKIQCYESALETSYRGDAVFRIRSDENRNLIVEDINPSIYFPVYDENNVRKEPKEQVLAWKIKLAGLKDKSGNDAFGLFIERHQKGKILSELWQLEGDTLAVQLDVKAYFPNVNPEVSTNIDRFLVIHNKNWGINSRFFGISDYNDLLPLMYAINNRVTKVDAILDKHGDPILAVPEGVIDKDGKAKGLKFGLIEVDMSKGTSQVPQYIVWDAKLESAFSEIDRLVEFFYMTSATSKSAFGMDSGGQAESGRALKYKLLRTIAKKHKKELYYDISMKDVYYTSQVYAKENGLSVGGILFKGQPELPQIVWQDGIINDATEITDNEIKKVDAGLQSEVEAIATIDGISQEDAQEKLDKIKEEKKANMPTFAVNPYNVNDPLNNKGGINGK